MRQVWGPKRRASRSPDVIYDELAWQIEEGIPEFRFTLAADHSYGPWRFLTRLHFYDNFRDLPIEWIPMHADESFLVDVELSYTLTNLPFIDAATIAFGAENLFDHYPSRPARSPLSEGEGGEDYGLKYAESSPYGFHGGFYYLRAGFDF